jgi:iron complex outermembrane receptor protein
LNLGVSYSGQTNSTPWQGFLKANNLTDRLAYAHTSFIKNAAPLMGRNVTVGGEGGVLMLRPPDGAEVA